MALKNVCLLLLAVVTVTLAAFDSINKVINYYLHKIAETGIQDPDFELEIRICIQIWAVFRIRRIRIRIVCFWASRIWIRTLPSTSKPAETCEFLLFCDLFMTFYL
jgi:hypothetical protein